MEGKSIETFLAKNEKPAFESIDIKPIADLDDTQKATMISNLKSLISMDLKSKGVDDDTITNLTALYEANGTLFDKAKASKEGLIKTHKANVEAKIKAEEAQIEQDRVTAQKEINAVREMITKNDINGTSIPAGDIKAFSDAMFKPVNAQGDTLMDVKRNKLTLAQRALIDYIVFKDFKVTGLATKTPTKSFDFSKIKSENDKRKGGRTNGASSTGDDNRGKGIQSIDIKNFLQKQTIN